MLASVRAVFAVYMLSSVLMASLGFAAVAADVPENVLFYAFIAAFMLWLGFIRSAGVVAPNTASNALLSAPSASAIDAFVPKAARLV